MTKPQGQTSTKGTSPKPSREWLWWTVVVLFIVGTITFLLVIDAIYAPKAYDPNVLPDAVGK